jgi:16S rRNA (guanine527-N7)-methyltransferase
MKKGNFISSLRKVLSNLNIQPSDSQLSKLESHFNLLVKYNSIINLTAYYNPSDIASRLFADSLLALNFIKERGIIHIVDAGPGGGFPSIPLAVFLPGSVCFTLIEKRRRVVYYLEELISLLSLENVEIINDTFEDFSSDSRNIKRFDLSLNKASLQLQDYLEKVHTILKPDCFALYWASNFSTTQNAFHNWGIHQVIPSPFGQKKYQGSVVVFQKTAL